MADAVPDIQDLEVNFQIKSPDGEDKIQKLYQAWLKRCPVYLALTKPLSVKTTLARAV
jgi:hypothetical protein